MHLLVGNGKHGNHARAAVCARDLEHARANVVVGHDDVAQKYKERLICGFLGRAVNRMAQAQRLVLVNVGNVEIATRSTSSA